MRLLQNYKIITALIFSFLFSILPQDCYGWGLIKKPGHTIILAGIAQCEKDGVIKPDAGATVNIHIIYDVSGITEQQFTPPQSTTTDENGVWVLVFEIPLLVNIPNTFEGELISRCCKEPQTLEIGGLLEPTHNLGAAYSFITGHAGDLGGLVLEILKNLLKIKIEAPSSTEYHAFCGFVRTTVSCDKKEPRTPEVVREPIETEPLPEPTPPQPPSLTTPQIPEPTPTPTPTTPQLPPTIFGPKEGPKPKEEAVDEYAKCVEKCKPILDKLKPLEERLKKLDESSDEVKRLQKELDRLKALYERNLKNSKQQQYIAPDGKEHWGLVRLEYLYTQNGYKPVPGTERTSPAAQAFLDFLKKKIEETEAKLKDAQAKDEKGKEAERAKIKEEMARIRKEYEDCVRNCDKYKEATPKPKDATRSVGMLIELMPKPKDVVREPQIEEPVKPKDTMPQPPAEPVPGPGEELIELPPEQIEVKDVTPKEPVTPKVRNLLTGATGIPIELPPPDVWELEPKKEELKVKDEVEYKEIKEDDVTCHTGVSYKTTPTGMDVNVSSLTTGKGINFRRWEVDKVKLNLDGDKIRPDEETNFYVAKESYFKGAAVTTLVVLGSRYSRYADKAKSSGDVCHVSEGEQAQVQEQDSLSKQIDRAGMAAGLGLLASQAKGDLTGKRSLFKLDKNQAQQVLDNKAKLEVTTQNKDLHQTKTFKTSLH